MAITKISVQQISDELFKLTGRNYLFINKENVTLDATPVTITKDKLLNADLVEPSWKEIERSSFAFVRDPETEAILTEAKIISYNEAQNQIVLVADATDSELLNELEAHKEDKNNPHEVTAEQVGLGNVDNTSDLDKPVSNAVQEALDLKANVSDIPEKLPNPSTLTVNYNDEEIAVYDGSEGKTVDLIVNAETVPMSETDETTIAEKIKEHEELIINFPLRTLQDKVYTKEEIFTWFGVTDDIELKNYIAGKNPIYVKYGISLSYNPHYYKFPVDYIAYESANQLKLVFNGLNTRDDVASKYTIIFNLDGTIIEGSNSNISIDILALEPEEQKALILKINDSEVLNYNGDTEVTENIILNAETIPVSASDATTIKEELDSKQDVIEGIVATNENLVMDRISDASNQMRLKVGDDIVATFPAPSTMFTPQTTFVANEIKSFYEELGFTPETVNGYDFGSSSDPSKGDINYFIEENGPYLVFTKMDVMNPLNLYGGNVIILKDILPIELPNPESLTIQFNGSTIDTYDGSEAKVVNIEAATKEYVQNLIDAVVNQRFLIVDELPTEDIKTNTIYLVLEPSEEQNDVYEEYVYINESWELLGTTRIDLSNYLAKDNAEEYTPTSDYNPATKKYVDDALDTVYTKEEVDEKLELIVNFPLRSLKNQTYTKEEILGWFGVTTDAELKGYIAGQNPIYVKYGILLSYNPHYYKFPVDYIAYESANQIKMVFNGLDTSNDKVSKYEIIMNLDGTIIEGSNSNVSMVLTHIEPEELLESYLSKDNETEYTPTSNYNPATKKYVDDSTSDKITINDIPTELPNPELLTIQVNGVNVDTYNGSEAKTIDIEIPDVATPDWSVSDPEDPSYIKNRTHYSTTNITNVYDDDATKMDLSRGANGVNWYVAQINTASAGVNFSQVDVINLTLGEVEYTNVVKNSVTVDDNGVQTEVYYFGNQLAMSSFSPYEGAIDTGEPFTILVDSNVILVCLRTENASGYVYTNIKLDAVVSETVHKLDNKYLDILKDSTISTETGYSSFKIEESLAQLDNKYVTLEDKSINITWDGNTTDKVASTPVGLYKVSDNVYNGVDLLGVSVSLSNGTTVEVTEFLENNTPATVIAIDNARVVIVRQANYKDNEGYTYPETGVYFSNISSIYVNSFTRLDVQEIEGTKNFVGEVTVNEPTQDTNPATKKYVDDSINLINTENSVITGVKTFEILPESTVVPTNDNQLVNKAYVDQVFEIYQSSLVEQLAKLTTPTNFNDQLSDLTDVGEINE